MLLPASLVSSIDLLFTAPVLLRDHRGYAFPAGASIPPVCSVAHHYCYSYITSGMRRPSFVAAFVLLADSCYIAAQNSIAWRRDCA